MKSAVASLLLTVACAPTLGELRLGAAQLPLRRIEGSGACSGETCHARVDLRWQGRGSEDDVHARLRLEFPRTRGRVTATGELAYFGYFRKAHLCGVSADVAAQADDEGIVVTSLDFAESRLELQVSVDHPIALPGTSHHRSELLDRIAALPCGALTGF